MGNRRLVNAPDIQERYQNTCGVAKTRSVISFGLSMFKLFKDSENTSEFNYHVQTFNIVTLCSEDYIVEPSSLQFLVSHGFDFNKQYSQGLPYFRGDDKVINWRKMVNFEVKMVNFQVKIVHFQVKNSDFLSKI